MGNDIIFSFKLIRENKLTLDGWLQLMSSDDRRRLLPNNCFPIDEFLNQYIDRINHIQTSKDFSFLKRKNIFMNSKGSCLMSKQKECIKEIKLLDSEIDLCNRIRNLLNQGVWRDLQFKKEYTDYEILQIALNRLMNELTFRY